MQFAQIHTIPEVLAVAKVIVLGALAFFFAMAAAPILTNFLYKHKIGVRIKETSVDGDKLSYVNKLHAHKAGTPIMGGILVWAVVLILAVVMNFLAPLLSEWLGNVWVSRLDFLSRSQVWLPLFALITTALLGLADDYMSIKKIGGNKGGGMRFLWRFIWLIIIAILGAVWFYYKLEWDTIHLPAIGDFEIGFWYVPLFVLIIVATAVSSNETDGLDGLNAGILLQGYSVFAVFCMLLP